jgi:hypothetical protein
METVTVKPHFSGLTHLQCEVCEGEGYVTSESLLDGHALHLDCAADGCCSGMIECGECADGTPADVILVCGDALCVGCLIRDGLPQGVPVARSTAAGAEWLKGWAAEVTQELPAIDDTTEVGPVFEVRYPPVAGHHDNDRSTVELPAIGGA